MHSCVQTADVLEQLLEPRLASAAQIFCGRSAATALALCYNHPRTDWIARVVRAVVYFCAGSSYRSLQLLTPISMRIRCLPLK
jgi:hypothetical protein